MPLRLEVGVQLPEIVEGKIDLLGTVRRRWGHDGVASEQEASNKKKLQKRFAKPTLMPGAQTSAVTLSFADPGPHFLRSRPDKTHFIRTSVRLVLVALFGLLCLALLKRDRSTRRVGHDPVIGVAELVASCRVIYSPVCRNSG